ncbi:MAG: tetratricopeptide repeat protein [Candidatus Obscuribacterales bacterium]
MEKSTGQIRKKLLAGFLIVSGLSLGLVLAMHPSSQSCLYKNRGQYRRAIDTNIEGQKNPLFAGDPGIELDIAYCFRQSGDLAEARRHLALARELASGHGYLWLFRPHGLEHSLACEEGWIDMKSKQYEEALATFDRALALEKSAEAYSGRAAVLESLGRDSEALSDYEAAIKCSTGHDREVAYHERAIFYTNRGKTDEAIADLTSALKADTCNRAFIDRAMLYKKQGYDEKALNDLSSSISNAGTERAYHERALLKRARGDFDGAIKDIDAAMSLDSSCARLEKDRDLILAESGKAQPQSQEQ